MVTKTYSLRVHKDGVLTVKVGRQVEHIMLVGKTKSEIFDAVKYALISKSAWFSDDHLTDHLHTMIWRHIDG